MAFEKKAFSYYQAGDYQKAIDISDQGILLAKSNQDTVIEASLLTQKAQSQIELNEIQNAKQNLNKAIYALQHASTPEYLATAYSIYAYVLSKEKEYKTAISYYKQAFGLNQQVENWMQCSRDLMNLGYLYDHELKNEKQALACFTQSIAFAEKTGDRYQLAGLFNNIGSVYWRRQEYK